MEQLEGDFDAVVVAVGASEPGTLPVPGAERLITALDFLVDAKTDGIKPGKRVVIIGAGNVGCDVATEAHRLGAEEITLLDVQKPASFGKEREDAEAAGAKFKWPVFTKEITEEGVVLQSGELIPADTVFVSIGDQPNIDFLPNIGGSGAGFCKGKRVLPDNGPQDFRRRGRGKAGAFNRRHRSRPKGRPGHLRYSGGKSAHVRHPAHDRQKPCDSGILRPSHPDL